MAQLTIYLDDDTATRMRAAAKGAHISVSRWLANLVRERVATAWPPEVVALAGSWADEDIARPVHGRDIPREPL